MVQCDGGQNMYKDAIGNFRDSSLLTRNYWTQINRRYISEDSGIHARGYQSLRCTDNRIVSENSCFFSL